MKKPKLVLIDDDQDVLDLLIGFFRPKGYELQTFDDAEEALKYLSRNTGHGGFLNVIKAYEVNGNKQMCILLFERYIRFCDFLVN